MMQSVILIHDFRILFFFFFLTVNTMLTSNRSNLLVFFLFCCKNHTSVLAFSSLWKSLGSWLGLEILESSTERCIVAISICTITYFLSFNSYNMASILNFR